MNSKVDLKELSNKDIWPNLKDTKTSKNPIAIFMMGIPASGKSTSIKYVLESMSMGMDDFIHLDPDIMMTYLDGYNNSKASEFNLSGVIITRHILQNILEFNEKKSRNNKNNKAIYKHNFIYYGTGRSYKHYKTMINKAKKNNYKTVLVNVKLSVEEAKKRSKKRTRLIPNNVINHINKSLKEVHKTKNGKRTGFEILREQVDDWYIVNNEGILPRTVVRSTTI